MSEWKEIHRKLRLDKLEVHKMTRGQLYIKAHWEITQRRVVGKRKEEYQVVHESSPAMYVYDCPYITPLAEIAAIALKNLSYTYYEFLEKDKEAKKYLKDVVR